MGIKRLLFRGAVRGMERLFLMHGLKSLYHTNVEADPVAGEESLDVVTIAFNNAKVIAMHNEYVKKYLKGNVSHIVVDNSTSREESGKIREICERDGIGYVRLHKNRMGIFSGSYNHATAVNWTYRHLLKPRKAWGFGFIDHDIFPVREIDLAEVLRQQPVYGAQRKRNEMWYLSAIVSFFRSSYVEGKKFDFMPVTLKGTYLDSGGGNWLSLYRGLDETGLRFMTNYTVNFQEGDNRHQDQIELFDDERWVHTINGSYWKKVSVVKEDIMSELIGRYEK